MPSPTTEPPITEQPTTPQSTTQNSEHTTESPEPTSDTTTDSTTTTESTTVQLSVAHIAGIAVGGGGAVILIILVTAIAILATLRRHKKLASMKTSINKAYGAHSNNTIAVTTSNEDELYEIPLEDREVKTHTTSSHGVHTNIPVATNPAYGVRNSK